MLATVISQTKNSSSSLLLRSMVSPPNHPPFFPPQTFPFNAGISSRPTQGPPRLTSPTAGPLSFFSGPPGWVGPFNSQNPYEPTRTHHNHPGSKKILWSCEPCFASNVARFFRSMWGCHQKNKEKLRELLWLPWEKNPTPSHAYLALLSFWFQHCVETPVPSYNNFRTSKLGVHSILLLMEEIL